MKQEYAPKTIQAVLFTVKQVFKWGWRKGFLRDYQLASVSFPKAKSSPQPCFTTEQVEGLIEAGSREQKLAFALMAYAGLRIGEVEQLRWEDVRCREGKPTMIHIRRGGSAGTTKDKDERFVPVHPRIGELLGEPQKAGTVLKTIGERILLKRLKELCKTCGFDDPQQFKLHSFRHHFASLCANHGVAHRKALAWLGHSSSDMLDLYYHLHDDDSEQAMMALAGHSPGGRSAGEPGARFEGSLRAVGQSRIESSLQAPENQELATSLSTASERGGFEPPVRLPAHTLSKRAP